MMRWLVTGASGFLGLHVAAELRDEFADGVAMAVGRRRPPTIPPDAFATIDLLKPGLEFADLLSSFRPDRILHLAGRTPPADSGVLERENVELIQALIEPLRQIGRPGVVVIAGSAAEYGPVDEADLPVREDHPCRPESPYGRGKLQAWRRARELAEATPIRLCNARLFNLIGPGMPPSLALGRFARALAAEHSGPVRLSVGDLHPRRDFVDVRDAAHALVRLGRSEPAATVYNVATGRSHSIEEGLERLIALSGRSVILETDEKLAARPGPGDSRGDPSCLERALGWRPAISFEQSLTELWKSVQGS